MLDGLEDCWFDLPHSAERILLQLLDGEDLIDVLAEIHPLDSLLTVSLLHRIHSLQLLVLLVGEVEVESTKNSPELQPSHDVLSEPIEI